MNKRIVFQVSNGDGTRRFVYFPILNFPKLTIRVIVIWVTMLFGMGLIGFLSFLILQLLFMKSQLGWSFIIASISMVFGFQFFFMEIISLYIDNINKAVKLASLNSIIDKINL